MASSPPADRTSPFHFPEIPREVNSPDNPRIALKARQLACGIEDARPVGIRELIGMLAGFAAAYEAGLQEAEAAEGARKKTRLAWDAKDFGIKMRRRYACIPGIDRVRAYVKAHFGGELCARTANLLLNSLCHHCGIREAELLTLDEAVDMLKREAASPVVPVVESPKPPPAQGSTALLVVPVVVPVVVLIEREPPPVPAPVVESPEPSPSEGLLLCPGATKDQLEEVAAIRRSNQRAGDKLLNIDRIKTIAEGLTCRQIGDYLGVKHQTVCKTRWWKGRQREVNERNHQAKHAWRRD